ncbi:MULTISPECIES: ABC transporter permease [unclassified Paenibacillus]|uniref:ABC transporter permease n=1 Tax=unclassified Paenibacillus TaxID=185978 RepID=UPI0024060FEA|nr:MULTISPECIES: ABC transporter permease [unclassified Paenibacillus]MDF9842052.1 peptide/nickel transport system permease protein [Paenibacillus sp. PastF-2]MDF9848694.1 peptide/nickel transport system permease protein [Paenibacillus sp. PastM-2]MDF9855263.1 peptide/nickel transport system permease protein [Paenibacillus sp. PastF-1]MDH6480534.1 peptide/nickel transport system permease protein [Paenibacillus sp. PastH-2]MDH6507961.1 peptide/nickel transport system permease protein [Paenibaci
MGGYLLRKTSQLIPTIIGVVTLVFIIIRLIPGDATAVMAGDSLSGDALQAMKERLGLDVPVWRQYIDYWLDLLRMDLGTTLVTGQSVLQLIVEALPVTFIVAVLTVLIACLIGVALGTLAAFSAHKGRKVMDRFITWLSMLVDLMPSFWMALLLMLLFTLTLGWLPATGPIHFGDPASLFRRIALPLIVLCLGQISTIVRITRTSVLEVLGEDYVRTARAFGAPELLVVFRHALKNAAMPIITVAGLAFGNLMNGTVITEFIFSIPGIGSLLIGGIKMRDYTLVQNVILVYSLLFIMINMLTDILYRRMDPRVKF